jgi:hypothetical protein
MGITRTRVAILGGGVAGCLLARRIGPMRRVEVDLFERRDRLGGAPCVVDIDGATFEPTPAIFADRHPLFALFPGLDALFVRVEHRPFIVTPSRSLAVYPPLSWQRALRRALSRALLTYGPSTRSFVRPRDGFEAVFAHIAEDLRVDGVRTRLCAEVTKIEKCGSEVVVTANGRSRRYDKVLSTIPLRHAEGLAEPVDDAPGDRDGLSLYYRFRGRITAPGDVFHNFTRSGAWRRIVVLSRYYGSVENEEYFVVECAGRGGGAELIVGAAHDFEVQLATLPFFDGVAELVGASPGDDESPHARLARYERIASLHRSDILRGIDLGARPQRARQRSAAEPAEPAQRLDARLDQPRESARV